MKKACLIKATALLLCGIMLLGMLPVTTVAVAYTEKDSHYLKMVSMRDWELAPGIHESEIILARENGSQRQVCHVVEVDPYNPYTKVMPSTYKMAEGLENKEYQVQVMSEQVKYAEEHGYGNVVAATNVALNWYDETYYKEHPELIGEPLGTLIMDGVKYTNSQGPLWGAATCLVINFDEKDGVPRPANMPKTEMRWLNNGITGWEEQLIPIQFYPLVENGKNIYPINDPEPPAPRTFVGIKADGTIVIVMNEGRQEPFSRGFNCYEMAEFMISLGCVWAFNSDGGGSSTFLSQRPGEELELHCSPSDGGERPTTHGILVISTAPTAGEFEEAKISSDYDYYTPGSSVQFRAVGSDHAGAAADIPANAVWKLADPSFGTLENGLFVSNGKQGTVTVQMTVDGEVVGQDIIHIVQPNALAFEAPSLAVPYGGRIDLGLKATYNDHYVALKASDVSFVLSDPNVGRIDGFYFTAGTQGLSPSYSILTAAVGTLSANVSISLGKGPRIIYSFENEFELDNEDRKLTGWALQAVSGDPVGELHVVNRGSGKGKNGDFILSVACDYSQVSSMGEHALRVTFPEIDCAGATSVGFWLYVPYEARHARISFGNGGPNKGELMAMSEGWHYVTAPVTGGGVSQITFSVSDQASPYYNAADEANLNGKYTFYIDDITLDYSNAVGDRHAPVFSAPIVMDADQTTFEVSVSDNTAFPNTSGIAPSTAKAYVDGVEVDCTYENGKIKTVDLQLADGFHTVLFRVSDRQENEAWIDGGFTVQTGSDAPTVLPVPRDPAADRLLIGSLYWMDLIATDIETIDEVELKLDLNNSGTWELAGMTVAQGFTATYAIRQDDNTASIIITRTGENTAVGKATLASIPVRTWVSESERSPAALVKDGVLWAQSVELSLEKGEITYAQSCKTDALGAFGMEKVRVDTELFFNYFGKADVNGAQAWIDACLEAGTGFHIHTVVAVPDQAPGATQDGFAGRSACSVCGSVVSWGTILPATGHTYRVMGTQLVCSDCGESFDGFGLHIVGGKAYYLIGGKLQKGWISVGDDWYYFTPSTYAGADGKIVADQGVAFTFEQGRLTEGVWVKTSAGTRYWYGPSYYKDTSPHPDSSRPYVIDGKTYLFNKSGYMLIGVGPSFVGGETRYYIGDENGVASLYTGPYGNYFYKDGVQQNAYKLVECNGDFYFISDRHMIARSVRLYMSEKFVAGLKLADGAPLKVGYYEFGADGKMIVNQTPSVPDTPDTPTTDPNVKNGVIGEFLYINDVRQTCYKLVKYDGDYYFINDGHQIARNRRLYLSAQYVAGHTYDDGTPLEVGYHEFDAEGKMIVKHVPTVPSEPETSEPETSAPDPNVKNGVIGEFLYINDVRQTCYKLVKYDGDYYFINDGHQIARSCRLYLGSQFVTGHTDDNGAPLTVGYYHFDDQGRMILN